MGEGVRQKITVKNLGLISHLKTSGNFYLTAKFF